MAPVARDAFLRPAVATLALIVPLLLTRMPLEEMPKMPYGMLF